jgi:Ca-activated chloride channel family protein
MVIQPPMAPPKEQISPKEMVFVIDQTGSQMGWPIAKAKETMRYCIANMNPGDTFQLIGFNTQIYPCFSAPVPNTPENVARALKFLEPIEGNGGTNILQSVDYALNIPDDPDRLRIVCYMTDGYVGNDMQILDYIQKHRGRARMFPFGIGNSVNRFLIEGMAREGCGAPEYVAVSTNQGAQFGGPMPESGVKGAKECAERFYRRIASPLLLDVQVDWNGLPVEDIYPKQIPDVFSAGPIILKGRYTHAAEGDITIHGLLRGKPWSRTIHVTLPAAHSDGSAIQTLWAREKIEDLQSQDWLGAQTNAPKPEIKEQIINTALEYHLMSQYTSFVAVEQRVVNIGGRQRLLDVPVETPDGVSYNQILGPDKRSQKQLSTPAAGFGFSYDFGAGALGGLGRRGVAASNQNSLPSTAAKPGKDEAKALSQSLKKNESAPSALKSDPASAAAGGNGAAKPLSGAGGPGDLARRKSKDTPALQTFNPVLRAEAEKQTARDAPLSAEQRLAAMKPEERRAVIEQAKLSPELRKKLENSRKARGSKPEVVEVQVWVNTLPPGGIAKLKALGFTLEATLSPSRLLLGAIALDKLDEMLKLSYVQRVESPKFK